MAFLVIEDDLHGLGVRPGDGRIGAAGEEGHFRPFDNALADDGQVLVGFEGVLEARRHDRAGKHVAALLGAHSQRRPGADLVVRLDVLLGAAHQTA